MKIVKLILILLVGGLLTYLTYKSKYRVFFGDALIWSGLVLAGLILVIWIILKDYKLYRTENRVQNFSLTFLCLLFVAIILAFEIKIQSDFNKPTLLKVFYDGDYNGTGIDFKTDGTYIFDNSAIGLSAYFYGTYNIDGNRITLDRDKIDNLTNLKYLEIRDKQIEEGKTDLYLYQVDTLGNLVEQSDEYRVTIDNRKK